MSVFHNSLPQVTPTMLRFLWKTHRMRIVHETDERMTVQIRSREDHKLLIARFEKRPGSGAIWQVRDPHREHGRLAFLDIERHLIEHKD